MGVDAKKKSKEFLLNLFLLTVSLLVVTLIFELFLAHFAPQKTTVSMICDECQNAFDPLVGYTYPSHIVVEMKHLEFEGRRVVNSLGFLDEEIPQKNGSQFRVMVLGDSFVEGWQVDQEDRFTEAASQRVDDATKIMNFGIGGYNNCQEMGVLKKFAEEVDPDLVVVVLYLGNDLRDNDWRISSESIPRCIFENNSLTVVPAVPAVQSARSWILRSHTVYFFTNTIVYSDWWQKIASRFSEKQYTALEFYSENISDERAFQYNTTGAILEEMNSFVQENGAKMRVVLLPDAVLGSEASRDRVLLRYNIDTFELDSSLPVQRLRSVAPNVEFVDATLMLRKASATNETYFPINRHLTVYGNEVVAEELANIIREQKESNTFVGERNSSNTEASFALV